MSETKFTPGPWRRGTDGTHVMTDYRDGNGNGTTENHTKNGWGKRIANVEKRAWMTWDEQEGNYNLIAAAPDMYEALEMAILEYGKPGGPWNVPSKPGSWIDKAKTALKKARGEA